MGFGLGTTAGMIASIFHIFAHAATKSLLFLSVSGLSDASGDSDDFFDLTGAGFRNKLAGAAFTVGALSMVGFPMFSGFISKFLFAQAAINGTWKMLPALIVLSISTLLNAVYFMKTVIRIYTPEKKSVLQQKHFQTVKVSKRPGNAAAFCCLIALNIILGLASETLVELFTEGLSMFS